MIKETETTKTVLLFEGKTAVVIIGLGLVNPGDRFEVEEENVLRLMNTGLFSRLMESEELESEQEVKLSKNK